MSDAPSWLTEDAGTGADANAAAAAPSTPAAAPPTFSLDENAAGAGAAGGAAASADKSGANAASSATEATEEKELPTIVLFMRLANMAAAIALIVCSILVMATIPSVSNWVLAIYATIGGLLICCQETQLKFLRVIMAMNFGFLFSPFWRFWYYILMASVCWAYDNLFGKIVAIAMATVAMFNTYILFRYPSYRKVRERIAKEEDARIEAQIQAQVRQRAVGQLTS